ncbi:lysophospholipid acyltransferase family protein [Parasedimentitalea maritima]|uniref:Acyltransferase n=1 Tax=Parasedimentitalea maritima TaxID=2578117 RepID=A0A6A4RMF3_9RHOB|nr:lysophospholipid acyltransferase family protein [Zongyanglinia marina]KAE9631868.1 acyltransferase [Zongyanglinia marina]
MQARHIARDISYAHSAETRSGRFLIKLMENSTGRLGLIKRAKGYQHDITEGHDFWSVMAERYGLTLDVMAGSLTNIPKDGPLILIANHPYGILDGLMMGHILSQTRSDFRILAHRVFQNAEDLNRVVLPVSFEETKDALKTNLQTRKTALNYLGQGEAIGIFPGGTVSTGARRLDHPMDPRWRGFTARMVAKSNATVVPLFFEGHTSRLFQIASHLHGTLRMGLLIKEFKKRVDTPVKVAIGDPLQREVLDPLVTDSKAMMDFLRKATYELSPKPLNNHGYGYEFEDRHRA